MSAPSAMPTDAISTPAPTPAPSCACVAAVSSRDEARIATLEPDFGAKVRLLLTLMAIAGHRMFVTSARRTAAEQSALYAQGRRTPGPIVTHLDGIARRSKHQDGEAVDCAFVGDDIWDGPWEMYGRFAEGLGLTWGGSWKKFADRPHVEAQA